MKFSHALPIEFYLNGVATFNEKIEVGVQHKCYFQKVNCEDPIGIQFYDTIEGEEYSLKVLDKDGNVVDTFPFVPTEILSTPETIDPALQFDNQTFAGTLLPWVSKQLLSGNRQPFVWTGDNALSDASSSGFHDTAFLCQSRQDGFAGGWPPGEYQVTVVASNFSNPGTPPDTSALHVYGSDDVDTLDTHTFLPVTGTNTWAIGATGVSRTVTFELTDYFQYLCFGFYKVGPSSGYDSLIICNSITIDSAPTQQQEYERTVYSLELTPDEDEFCDGYFKMEVYDSEDELKAYTDYFHVKQNHEQTRAFLYTNDHNFADIDYISFEEAPQFLLRLESKFADTRLPEENESEDLGDGTIAKLSGSVKEQRMVETEAMPPYMHRKFKLVLKHNSITSDNRSWLQEESYDMDKEDDESLFSFAKVWLTLKDDNYVTNVF